MVSPKVRKQRCVPDLFVSRQNKGLKFQFAKTKYNIKFVRLDTSYRRTITNL